MGDGGNRYSDDGSYDFVWDGRFPLDGDILWPRNILLQLRQFAFSSNFFEKRHILILTQNKLTIAEEPKPPDEFEEQDLDYGYRFYTGELKNELLYEPLNISLVELLSSFTSQGIGIAAQDERGRQRRIFRAQGISVSRAVLKVADECMNQGVLDTAPRRQLGHAMELSGQLMYREIERQFKRVAPQADFVLKGKHLPLQDFQKIIA